MKNDTPYTELQVDLEKLRIENQHLLQTEQKLQDSQRRLGEIIDFLPDATFAIDLEGKIIFWNKAMELMTNTSAQTMVGKGNFEYSLPFYGVRRPILIDLIFVSDNELQERYHFVQKNGDSLLAEADVNFAGKGVRHLWGKASPLYNEHGEIIGAIEAIRDITEQKTAEQERNELLKHLQRAEKMEALGNLAGGVAHDLNNMLGVIIGYSELILASTGEDDIVQHRLSNILKSGNRASAIVQDLLTLARRGVLVKEVVNLNRIIGDIVQSAEFSNLKQCNKNICFQSNLKESLPNIEGSPVHFEKAILNLVINAVEAMSQGGELTISTDLKYLDTILPGYDKVREGNYVLITVEDSGEGISEHDMEHIFEPFYTRKVMGKSGTGLGLAVVWGTVLDHEGYVYVKSRTGVGTTFFIYIPASTKQIREEDNEEIDLSLYQGNSQESILVVDDVYEQGQMAVEILTNLHYSAHHVRSGEEAVEYIKENDIQLVVLDMIMDPGMDGLDTYLEILKINHQAKAIIVSGYAETQRVSTIQTLGGGCYLKKPYSMQTLAKAVREELDRP